MYTPRVTAGYHEVSGTIVHDRGRSTRTRRGWIGANPCLHTFQRLGSIAHRLLDKRSYDEKGKSTECNEFPRIVMTESEGRVHGYEPSSIPSTPVSVARCLSNTRTCLDPFNPTNMGCLSVGLYNPAGKIKEDFNPSGHLGIVDFRKRS